LWLFCYACCRRILGRLEDAIELAERHPGKGTPWGEKAYAASRNLQMVRRFLDGGLGGDDPFGGELSLPSITVAIWGPGSGKLDEADVAEQLTLLRDIVGNPFRPVKIRDELLAWNDGAIPKIAQAIYDNRAFGDVPILADALEEAGCP